MKKKEQFTKDIYEYFGHKICRSSSFWCSYDSVNDITRIYDIIDKNDVRYYYGNLKFIKDKYNEIYVDNIGLNIYDGVQRKFHIICSNLRLNEIYYKIRNKYEFVVIVRRIYNLLDSKKYYYLTI